MVMSLTYVWNTCTPPRTNAHSHTTGTSKMLLLEELRVELERQRTQQDYLERGVLKSLKLWLDPQDTEAKTFKASAATFPIPKFE